MAKVMKDRSARLLARLDPPEPRFDDTQLRRWQECMVALSPQWAVTAMRTPLNLWTTSTRLHDGERDSCAFGCPADDHLAYFLECPEIRMLVKRRDDSEPWAGVASVFGLGPAALCPTSKTRVAGFFLLCSHITLSAHGCVS